MPGARAAVPMPPPSIHNQYLVGRVDYGRNSYLANEEGFQFHRQELTFGFFGTSPTVEDVMNAYTGRIGNAAFNTNEIDITLTVQMLATLTAYLRHLDTEGDQTLANLLTALGIAMSWISFRDDPATKRSIIYRRIYSR